MEPLTLITEEEEYVPETTKPGWPKTEEAWKKVEEERIAWEKAEKTAEKGVSGMGNPKEPWQMTKREWPDAKWENRYVGLDLSYEEHQRRVGENIRLDYGLYPTGTPLQLTHEDIVRKAIREGKPVPPEVLAEYPDLKPPVVPEVTMLTGDIWNSMTPIQRERLGLKAKLDAEARGQLWWGLWPEQKRALIREFKKEQLVPPVVEEGNPGMTPSIIDLRGDYDEIAHVKDGILYRKGSTIQVWWDKRGKETWTNPSEEQARENFNAMKERWSSSELSNPEPGEPIGSNFHSLMLHAVAGMYGPGGIVVDNAKARATSCECVEYKPGKFWCTSKGVVGALTDEQEKIYCNPRVMVERPGVKERMTKWAESVEICRAQLPPTDGRTRLEVYLDCMSKRLTKDGVED